MDSLKHHVVFIATSTDEKVRDLNLIAEHKRLPLKFFNLRDLHELVGILHNTVEDGENAEANAEKKMVGIQKKIDNCRKNPQAVQEFCRQRGIEVDVGQIWFGTEDSGVSLPKEIWNNLPREIFQAVPKDVKERLARQISGPAVETAPFLSATLGAENINRLIVAAMKNSPDIIPGALEFDEKSVIKLESMALYPNADRTGKEPIKISAEGNVTNNYCHSL